MNDENILIIGDDSAAEETIHSPVPVPDKILTSDETWLSSRKNALAENFLEKHKAEFQDFERQEREKLACAERFHALETEIANRRLWLEALQKEIAACRDVDLAADILKNMELTGRPLLEIAQNPLFSAAALIKEHGKKLLQLAENQAADLQTQCDAFKSEKRDTLKELGLV
jgi:hypothetical protein